ncbi:DUF475 domain-containing protein [Candidatus Nomurabacteria bacterium]|nr:DUF475 domain-containing protein [Candidatus Nomurabacteria bacterium]
MNIFSLIITVVGLTMFEVISSIDNAIINADVLHTMGKRARKWFLFWGIVIGVFIVRGLLPWMIVWATNPQIGPWNALIASFSSDEGVKSAIEMSAPILLMGGGVYLVFLFFHWWFIEEKEFGLIGEKFIKEQGVWFFAIASVILTVIVWHSLNINPMMAFGAVVGSTAFFITQGFKANAEEQEKKRAGQVGLSDLSKVAFLMVIDATFSIDSVLGAFAFTLSVPLIFLGNGIGAVVVQRLTVAGVDQIKKYIFLKNGAMYSILFLGIVMTLDAFGFHIPSWVSPLITFACVGYFFNKSRVHLKNISLV